MVSRHPALKCRAILGGPYGTRSPPDCPLIQFLVLFAARLEATVGFGTSSLAWLKLGAGGDGLAGLLEDAARFAAAFDRRLFVIAGALHVAGQAFLLAEPLETLQKLLNGFSSPGLNLDHDSFGSFLR